MNFTAKVFALVGLAILLAPVSFAHDLNLLSDVLETLKAASQPGTSAAKVPVAVVAPKTKTQTSGTQSSKTIPRRGISLDDQRGNDWWSEQPTSNPGAGQKLGSDLKGADGKVVSDYSW